MKFTTHHPSPLLKPYITRIILSENLQENEHKVLPSSGLVIGFQYSGQLSTVEDGFASALNTAGVTGIADTYKIFRSSANTGTILVYFTETGFSHFTALPVQELFNLSVSLEDIFDKQRIEEVKEQLATAATDHQRIKIVEQFLLSQLKEIQTDQLIVEAVKLIYQSKGTIRIRELNEKLLISQSPFEKRFRKVVGVSPKKFASIVRFNAVLDELNQATSLTDLCYAHRFFDQAHFIKDFKQFTGETPEKFRGGLSISD